MLDRYSLLFPNLMDNISFFSGIRLVIGREDWEKEREGKVQGILNASSKICSLVVNGQSFLVTDGSLLNLF